MPGILSLYPELWLFEITLMLSCRKHDLVAHDAQIIFGDGLGRAGDRGRAQAELRYDFNNPAGAVGDAHSAGLEAAAKG